MKTAYIAAKTMREQTKAYDGGVKNAKLPVILEIDFNSQFFQTRLSL